jgi:anthranilate phosphoribosyltransferase
MKTDWIKFAPLTALAEGNSANTLLRPFIWRLMRGEDLTRAEAAEMMRVMLDRDRTNAEQVAAALTALAIKGETGAELAGMATVMRERAEPFVIRKAKFIDIGGTGSSAVKTFNVSTAAAFVIAGAGLPVAKNSNRRVSSAFGSIEVLEALGVRVNTRREHGGEAQSRETAQTAFEGVGLCFLSATAFHGAVNRVASVRGKLGLRTTLNLLGALSNPACPTFQIVGVWHHSLLEPMAEALAMLGVKRAWVVHGADGLDEITLARETFVVEAANGKINAFTIEPEDFGLRQSSIAKLKAKSAAESANTIQDVLSGTRRDEAKNLIVINAAAALLVSGLAKTPVQAARLAEQSIDSNSAQIKLERLIMTTNKTQNATTIT